jgi:hypothetical protein
VRVSPRLSIITTSSVATGNYNTGDILRDLLNLGIPKSIHDYFKVQLKGINNLRTAREGKKCDLRLLHVYGGKLKLSMLMETIFKMYVARQICFL